MESNNRKSEHYRFQPQEYPDDINLNHLLFLSVLGIAGLCAIAIIGLCLS